MEYKDEVWLPIEQPTNTNGKYQISSFGRLKRTGRFTKDGRWKPELIINICKSGRYIRCRIMDKTISVHRLVCFAFHPNPENKQQVNHKDNNKHNNHKDNLEWATQSENIRHAQSIGVMPYAKPKIRVYKRKEDKKHKPPKKIINVETGEIINSIYELSTMIGRTIFNIRKQLSGERYCHIPYRYVGEETRVRFKPVRPKKEKPPKKERPPRKVYVPHPAERKKMIMYSKDGDEIRIFNSSTEAAEFVGSNPYTFRKAIKRSPNNFTKGYVFKYA